MHELASSQTGAKHLHQTYNNMVEKYIMVNLEDEKSQKLGEAISNPNCKKIITLLAEQELSASEISQKLKIKLSALDYSLKKLVASGIIEKSKHFWSVKGKRIPTYQVVNKVIVIQPKKISNSNAYSKLKGFIPVLFVMILLTLIIAFQANQSFMRSVNDISVEKSLQSPAAAGTDNLTEDISASLSLEGEGSNQQVFQPWMWFAFGALLVLIMVLTVNWKRL